MIVFRLRDRFQVEGYRSIETFTIEDQTSSKRAVSITISPVAHRVAIQVKQGSVVTAL